MNELLFPICIFLLVGYIFIPILSLLTQSRIEYIRTNHSTHHSVNHNYLLFWLLLPTVLPLSWMLFNTIHLLYSDILHTSHHSVCVLDHTDFWTDEGILLLLIVSLGMASITKVYIESKISANWLETESPLQQSRIHQLFPDQSIPKIQLVTHCSVAAQSVGIFHPRILLSLDWIEQIDDEMLRATILHEMAHIQTGDLRTSTLLKMGLVFNPTKSILKSSIYLWTQNKELNADQLAIQNGANQLALAQSIINALRWQRRHSTPMKLFGCYLEDDSSRYLLKLRLMKLTERHQNIEVQNTFNSVWTLGILVFLTTPHLLVIDAFDTIHHAIEQLALYLGVFQ